MKAAVIEQQGGVENIVYRDWDDPEPRPGEVRVSVGACGLNHLDIFVRRGMPGCPVPMPFISGGDIAGTIDALGDGVAGWWRIAPRLSSTSAAAPHRGRCVFLAVMLVVCVQV